MSKFFIIFFLSAKLVLIIFLFLENIEEYNNFIFNNKKKNKALNLDIFDAIKKVEADIIYLDPPYAGTMNDYIGFYGLIDSYITSKKRKTIKTNFTDNKKIIKNFDNLFSKLKIKYWYLSYNNQSYPQRRNDKIIKKYSKNVSIVEKNRIIK